MSLCKPKPGRDSRRQAGSGTSSGRAWRTVKPSRLPPPGRAAPARAPLRQSGTYVKTKNKVVEPTNKAAAVETGMYLVGLNLFPVLLGIL